LSKDNKALSKDNRPESAALMRIFRSFPLENEKNKRLLASLPAEKQAKISKTVKFGRKEVLLKIAAHAA